MRILQSRIGPTVLALLLLSTTHAIGRSLDETPAVTALRGTLDKIVDLAEERRAGNVGVLVVSLQTGETWFELNAEKALTPASTTKLLTSYSALVLFGADYRIPTVLYSNSPVASDGTLNGDLFVKGHGDPLLTVNDIDRLVDRLADRGLKRVTGSVIGDGSYFDGLTERMIYSGDADHVVDLPPVAGLGVGGNMVTVIASAPRTAGEPVRVRTKPPSSGFRIVNSAKSVRGKSTKNLAIRVEVDDAGDMVVRVSGTLGRNKSRSRRFEIDDPASVVAGMIYDRLESRGISVAGRVGSGVTPGSAVELASIFRPLDMLLQPIMKKSHNFYAEHLFKMIGGASGVGSGKPTAASARGTIVECLRAGSAPVDNLVVNDGSGLSRRNLIAPATLVATLEAARHNPLLYTSLFGAMSIAGIGGTLRKRMRGTPAAGNLRGKTGTLRNVSSLCGYVETADGEPLAFSIVMNGNRIATYKSVQNHIGETLARFSRKVNGDGSL